jgi:hypothetical protein
MTVGADSRGEDDQHGRESECRLLDRNTEYVRENHGFVSTRN